MATCVAAIWLLTRRYSGIAHDSLFYTVQALRALYPERYVEELYFKFGSQDQFTLFTYLYAPVIKHIGLSWANLSLTIAGQAAWLAALIYFIRAFTRRPRDLLMAVALILAVPGTYGAAGLLSYGESFLTPRLPAESGSLLAMGLLVRGRPLAALSLAGLSASLHPIIALPGLGVIFFHQARRQWLWFGAAIAVGILLVSLAGAGISPFSHIGATFDNEWLDSVRERSPFIFLLRWGVLDWCLVVATAAVLVLAWFFSEGQRRTFLSTTIMVGGGGILCALLGGDIIHNVLVVEVQPLRVLWLVTLVAHISILPVYRSMSSEDSDTGRLLCTAFLVGVALLLLMELLTPAVVLAAPVLFTTCAVSVWLRMGGCLRYLLVRYCAITALGVVIGGTLFLAYLFARVFAIWPEGLISTICAFFLTVLALGITLTIGLRVRPTGKRRSGVEALVTVSLFCVSLLIWDHRQPWDRFVEAGDAVLPALSELLPDRANVYWEGDIRFMWLRLKRPAYFSCAQGAGSMFFRGTAMEYQHRAEIFSRLHTLDFGTSIACPPMGTDLSGAATRDDLQYVCDRARRLDYLVLLNEIPGAPSRIWHAPVTEDMITLGRDKSGPAYTVWHTNRYFIYRCSDFRAVD